MHIAVVGSGYVGLVTGACLTDFGMDVTCVDNDARKIAMLKDGQVPIYEPGLEALVGKNTWTTGVTSSHLSWSFSDSSEAMCDS